MGKKPVVYLLPGLLCDEIVWKAQTSALAPQFDVRITNFRGMKDFRLMAESVLVQAPDRFSIVGHSMGGRVGLELLHLAPERIEAVVLMDIGAHPLQPGERSERMVLVDLAEEKGMEALADLWIPPMISESRHQDACLIKTLREMVLRSSPADYRGQIEAALGRSDQSKYLSEIYHEVLLVVGECDQWSPISQHQAIRSQLLHCHLEVIPHSGHMVPMEEPEALNFVLLDWLSRLL
jgi:pimeloyl-ACP methyl ester carboxylesterase